MIRLDSVHRRPRGAVRVLLNGREVKEVVAVGALWNGGPGFVEVETRIAGKAIVDEMRQRICTHRRFGLVRVEQL